jgi:methylenetetrahydrofolate dehydrogenase (NADP+) / methenyltetrahydrofolate cyclohydrolase
MLHDGQVIVDAGVASEDGRLVGDVAESVYESGLDIKITPRIGGVGPLTVAALFENLLIAAAASVSLPASS